MIEDAELANSQSTKSQDISLIVSNTLDEMVGQEASLASHVNTSFAVEKLTLHMSSEQLIAFIHNMSGLYCHLFTNRYGSHVIQTLLAQVSTKVVNKEKTAEFFDCINNIVHELDEHYIEIIKDASGSHALRTLITLLCGFEPIKKKQFTSTQMKKKKKKKKKKRKELSK